MIKKFVSCLFMLKRVVHNYIKASVCYVGMNELWPWQRSRRDVMLSNENITSLELFTVQLTSIKILQMEELAKGFSGILIWQETN